MSDWTQIEELTRMMAHALLERIVPPETCACTRETDQACDEWIRRWIARDPSLLETFSWLDPIVSRVLLARFRYATAYATMHRLAGHPLPKSSAERVLELYLIDRWYLEFRERWLSGEQGVAVSDN
ncbi:hypothetical protein OH491_13670 [Termitidicoccus mucosus]